MNYEETVTWLYAARRLGVKLGTAHTRSLLDALDSPDHAQPCIHVAGTNGKGSTCAMMDSILRAHGLTTGLYTSPHLISFRERIRVNGEDIPETEVIRTAVAARKVSEHWQHPPTFFELTTAMALDYFRSRNADVAIMETGLGGRLDSTNAITPQLSVITPIGMDHQAWLGNTLAEVATEKAGILKAGVPAVSATQAPEAKEVLVETARKVGTTISFISEPWTAGPLGLCGPHQRHNAALALAALDAGMFAVSDAAIREGLAQVSWPGRFQKVTDRLVVDGAHNSHAATQIAQTWQDEFGRDKATVVVAVLRDKNPRDLVRTLLPITSTIIATGGPEEKWMPAPSLARIIREVTDDVPVIDTPDIKSALATASNLEERTLITGSLHLVGDALRHLQG